MHFHQFNRKENKVLQLLLLLNKVTLILPSIQGLGKYKLPILTVKWNVEVGKIQWMNDIETIIFNMANIVNLLKSF